MAKKHTKERRRLIPPSTASLRSPPSTWANAIRLMHQLGVQAVRAVGETLAREVPFSFEPRPSTALSPDGDV
jgi:hypothetical protein